MSFLTDMQEVANDLLTEFGREVTFTRVVEGDYNPSTSDVGVSDTSTYSGNGHPAPYSAAEIATGTVLVKDVSLLLYSVTEPLIGDTVIIDNVTYRVMNVGKLAVQNGNVAYQLQLRV